MKNTQIKLVSRPSGIPTADNFNIETAEIPKAKDGEVIIKHEYISLDPAMRGWMNDSKSYIAPVQIGEVMRAGAVGKIIESKLAGFEVGDYVMGWTGVQQYGTSGAENLFKVDPNLMPLQRYLGTMGMPGFTAYFGLLEVGQAKEGETVLVSGAAGAVGSVVGQIAKIKGCKVVGIAGGPEKCNYLTEELGFDAAIDYKSGENLSKAIKAACDGGVDVYFDNVGGEMLDVVLGRIKRHARIVICGAISQYNSRDIYGPSNYLSLLVNRARMEGFVVFDYAKDYGKAAMEMAQWSMAGKLKSKEHIVEGIENFHSALLRLFSGDKMGKLVLKA